MKYIKKYKVFESNDDEAYTKVHNRVEQCYNILSDDVMSDIEYLLLDLVDFNGLEVHINKMVSPKSGSYFGLSDINSTSNYIYNSNYDKTSLESTPLYPVFLIVIIGDMNLRQLESDIDEALKNIDKKVNIKSIEWDYSRYDRLYNDDIEIRDYELKIVING